LVLPADRNDPIGKSPTGIQGVIEKANFPGPVVSRQEECMVDRIMLGLGPNRKLIAPVMPGEQANLISSAIRRAANVVEASAGRRTRIPPEGQRPERSHP